MSQDIHTPGLVVEGPAGRLAGFHVPGDVADEVAEGDAAIGLEGVPARPVPAILGNVHHLRVVVDDELIGRCEHPLVHDDTQDVGVERLGGRGDAGAGPGLDAAVLLEHDAPAAHHYEPAAALTHGLGETLSGARHSAGVHVHLLWADPLPGLPREDTLICSG